MSPITERARAKVNLTLRVVGRRADGYHEIESLIVFADAIADQVALTSEEPIALETTGPFAAAIVGRNLLEATLRQTRAAEPKLMVGAIALEKNIPVAAGLGGGSADAAALLRAIRHANPHLRESVDWSGIATNLGADVPVCFADRPAVVRGIGERISSAPNVPELPAVLVNSMASVPADKTAQVFARLATQSPRSAKDTKPASPLPDFRGDAARLIGYLGSTGNDLFPAARAIMPEIDTVIAALEWAPGCLFARMSGAGPTCFGLFASQSAAAAVASELSQAQPGWWVRTTLLG